MWAAEKLGVLTRSWATTFLVLAYLYHELTEYPATMRVKQFYRDGFVKMNSTDFFYNTSHQEGSSHKALLFT